MYYIHKDNYICRQTAHQMFVVEQLDEPGGILVVVDDLGIHSYELYQAKAGCLFHLVSCMPNREREDTLNNK